MQHRAGARVSDPSGWLPSLLAVLACSSGAGVARENRQDAAIAIDDASAAADDGPAQRARDAAPAPDRAVPDTASSDQPANPPPASDAATAAGELPWPEANAIVAGVRAPNFPDARFLITDHGAMAGGDSTAAIAATIAACAQAGGGHVIVPAGTFTTGAIQLADGVDLHLEAGATLAFSGDVSKYPIVLTRSDGIELMATSPAIYAHGCKNVGLTGSGVLDAAGTAAWNKDSAGGPAKLQGWGRTGTPVASRVLGAGEHVRVAFVEPYGCAGVLIQGVTMRNAPYWTLHPTLSHDVLVDGVTIETSVHNADGCDIESCHDVVVTGSTFATADDAVAVKSGRDQDGFRLKTPSENVVVMHSKFRSTYGLLTIGSQESGGAHHVFGYDLSTTGPVKYVLWIKSNRERGGDVADVRVDSVHAMNVSAQVVWATLDYEWNGTNNGVPTMDEISLSRITVDGAPQVLNLAGLPSSQIGTFTLRDSTFTNIARPMNSVVNVKNLVVEQVTVNGKPAP